MKGKINGIAFEAEEFGFDGCHKIYLCDNQEGKRKLAGYGYTLYPIELLPEVWLCTCPLRFISSGDLRTSYVGQGEDAHFDGWNLSEGLERELPYMRKEYEDWEA